MVKLFKKPEVIDFDMENRLSRQLSDDKALQLAQVAADAIKDELADEDSPFAVAVGHYENFYSSTNPTLFDDLLNISRDDAKQIVLKLLLKK